MELYYKVLNTDGSCYHGGVGTWHLPQGKRPGKWMPRLSAKLQLCLVGYHLVTADQLVNWLGPAIFVAEGRGASVSDEGKTAFAQARLSSQCAGWNKDTARLFACDCAEHVLPLFEAKRPHDPRPRQAIETARRYADGKASIEELRAAWEAAGAAWGAAWEAAGAARDAAGAAAWAAWDAAGAAGGAAWGAAWDAAGAAREAAGAAAGAAERKWQTERLMQYLNGEV